MDILLPADFPVWDVVKAPIETAERMAYPPSKEKTLKIENATLVYSVALIDGIYTRYLHIEGNSTKPKFSLPPTSKLLLVANKIIHFDKAIVNGTAYLLQIKFKSLSLMIAFCRGVAAYFGEVVSHPWCFSCNDFENRPLKCRGNTIDVEDDEYWSRQANFSTFNRGQLEIAKRKMPAIRTPLFYEFIKRVIGATLNVEIRKCGHIGSGKIRDMHDDPRGVAAFSAVNNQTLADLLCRRYSDAFFGMTFCFERPFDVPHRMVLPRTRKITQQGEAEAQQVVFGEEWDIGVLVDYQEDVKSKFSTFLTGEDVEPVVCAIIRDVDEHPVEKTVFLLAVKLLEKDKFCGVVNTVGMTLKTKECHKYVVATTNKMALRHVNSDSCDLRGRWLRCLRVEKKKKAVKGGPLVEPVGDAVVEWALAIWCKSRVESK